MFMRQKLDNVEIKDPFIGELDKKPSCIKRSCFVGCGLIVLFIIGGLLLLKFTTNEKPKELKSLPEFFPQEIPIYDSKNVDTITLQSEHKKNKELEWLLILPKLVASPVVIAQSDDTDKTKWQIFIEFITKPMLSQKEIITVEWQDLSASPDFLQEYYINELKKAGFQVILSKDKGTWIQFSFEKDYIHGLFLINDSPKTDGTDFLSLTTTVINKP
jgi:hypothetical protein